MKQVMSMAMIQETKVDTEPANYFDEYNTRHEALKLLSEAWWKAGSDLRDRISRAASYVRDTALDLIPYGATTPNKDSYGRRY